MIAPMKPRQGKVSRGAAPTALKVAGRDERALRTV